MKASLRLFVWLVLLALPFIRVFAQGAEGGSNDIFLAQMKPSEAVDSGGAPSKDKRREEEIPKDKRQNNDKGSPREGSTSKQPSKGDGKDSPSQNRPSEGGGISSQNKPQDKDTSASTRDILRGKDTGKEASKGSGMDSPSQGGLREGSRSKEPSGGSDKGSTSQGTPRDKDSPSGGSKRGGGKDGPPQDRRRGGSRDSPPHDRRAQHRGGGAIWWESYLSLSVPIPIISRDCGDEGGFGGAGGGVGFSLHKVNPETHFAMLIRMGIALTSGEFSGDFEDNFAEGQNASIGDVSAVYSYFRFGLGGAIEPSGAGVFVLIPTAGLGASYSTTSADVSVQRVYPTGVFEDSYEGKGGEVTLDVFVDLTALVMFTDHFGLSASFEAALNVVGTGSFDDVSYSVLPPSYTITPAVSLCFRF